MVAENFQVLGLRLLENTVESVYFYSCSQAKLFPRFLSLPQARRNYPFPQNNVSLKSIFSQQKGKRIMKLKKCGKLNFESVGHKF